MLLSAAAPPLPPSCTALAEAKGTANPESSFEMEGPYPLFSKYLW